MSSHSHARATSEAAFTVHLIRTPLAAQEIAPSNPPGRDRLGIPVAAPSEDARRRLPSATLMEP